MAEPAELIAEAASGRRPLLPVRALAWLTVAAVGLAVGAQVWFEVRMDDHMEKHDGQLTDIRVSIETVKGQVSQVDGKVSANSVATNARMDGMQGMIQRVFDAEFPTLKEANEAREYLDSHSAPPASRRQRHHHHAPTEDIGITAPRWTATL